MEISNKQKTRLTKNNKSEKIEALIRAKRLIKKAFLINYSIPKGYGTRSSDYQKLYNQKDRLINQAIKLIKNHNLSIKYGKIDDVDYNNFNYTSIAYFEFEGKQYSFHGYFNKFKKFNGSWQGFRNEPEVALHKRKSITQDNKIGYALPGIECCNQFSRWNEEIKNLVNQTRFRNKNEDYSGDWRNHYRDTSKKSNNN